MSENTNEIYLNYLSMMVNEIRRKARADLLRVNHQFYRHREQTACIHGFGLSVEVSEHLVKKQATIYATAVLAAALTMNYGSRNAALANLCSYATSCTLVLSEGNTGSGFGTGNFGTVDLELSGNSVTINIDLADGFQLVKTGFPGSIGFVDDLGGGLTIGDFSSALYSGSLSDTSTDLHFDGFGYASDAAATSGAHAGSGLNNLSFSVTGSGLVDVNELLQPFGGPAGQGPVYFVADIYNANPSGPGAGNTGLVAVTGSATSVPEPGSLAVFGASLLALGLMPRRSRRRR